MTDDAPIALPDLPAKVPDWPLSPWSTHRLIKLGKLGHVKIGRRLFVTRRLLAEYIQANTVPARAAGA